MNPSRDCRRGQVPGGDGHVVDCGMALPGDRQISKTLSCLLAWVSKLRWVDPRVRSGHPDPLRKLFDQLMAHDVCASSFVDVLCYNTSHLMVQCLVWGNERSRDVKFCMQSLIVVAGAHSDRRAGMAVRRKSRNPVPPLRGTFGSF